MMAKHQFLPPFSSWRVPLGGHKIKLSHEEIEIIDGALTAAKTLAGFIPQVGPFIAAAVVLSMWRIKWVNKSNGNQGVVIILALGKIGISVRPPMDW